MKLIIAGSRTFNDYGLLKKEVDEFIQTAINTSRAISVTVFSGKAKGADALGEQYARENNHILAIFPADWDNEGKKAGYIRNEYMAKKADACIVFWDGVSRGSKHMIEMAKKYNLKLKVVNYEKERPLYKKA